MWIGITERAVVALLTMCGAAMVTVFVFATKAALMGTRIDDKDDHAKKREATEYILIGTLASYFFGLLFGLGGWRAQKALNEAYAAPAIEMKAAHQRQLPEHPVGKVKTAPIPPALSDQGGRPEARPGKRSTAGEHDGKRR